MHHAKSRNNCGNALDSRWALNRAINLQTAACYLINEILLVSTTRAQVHNYAMTCAKLYCCLQPFDHQPEAQTSRVSSPETILAV